MDFLNLLIPKEKIVGIEIGEQKLRMLRLEKDGFGNIGMRGKSEVDLPDGAIVFGRVADKKKLSEFLAKLKKDFKPKNELSPYVVLTVSQNGIYSDILELPENLNNEQTIGAVSLNAAGILPLPLSECYIDWQEIERSAGKKKLLTSIIPKEIADSYISVLKENGFNLVALEPASLSIARVADISDEPVLFFYLTDEGITSIVYSHKNPYISRFESWLEASGGKEIKSLTDLSGVLKKKIKSLAYYFESQYSPTKIKKVLLASEGFDADRIIGNMGSLDLEMEKARSKIPSIKNYDLIAVAGAASRAFIPRSEDTVISLLPVGTESLYETEKAASFAKSVMFVALALSFFYSAVFVAAFIFVSFLGSSLDRQMDARSNMAVPAEYVKLEKETKEFNDYVSDLTAVYPKVGADYGLILENIGKISGAGITLSSVSLNGVSGPIMISGTALSRESLNAFKIQTENSQYFKEAKFSVQNIAQKNNIPFSLSLYSK